MSVAAILLTASAMSIPGFTASDFQVVSTDSNDRLDRKDLWSGHFIELLVGPNGRVVDCSVVSHVGDKATADRTCKLYIGHQMDVPSGPDGEPSYAVVTANIIRMATKLRPDFQFFAQSLQATMRQDGLPIRIEVPVELFFDEANPEGDSSRGLHSFSIKANLAVNIRIGIDGKMTNCVGANSTSQALAQAACAHVTAQTFKVRTHDGKPVPYLQSFGLEPKI